ncbi:MAG TPA: hypothetical protein VHM90_19345 [Phycisphaerae bacterium]|nr:hypothetical protein [Phycisphaerae bacterium]
MTRSYDIHISYMDPDPPAVGDIIHCMAYKGGRQLILENQMFCRIRSFPQIEVAEGTPVELRVIAIDPPDIGERFRVGKLGYFTLTGEFLRTLDWERL